MTNTVPKISQSGGLPAFPTESRHNGDSAPADSAGVSGQDFTTLSPAALLVQEHQLLGKQGLDYHAKKIATLAPNTSIEVTSRGETAFCPDCATKVPWGPATFTRRENGQTTSSMQVDLYGLHRLATHGEETYLSLHGQERTNDVAGLRVVLATPNGKK